MKKASTIIILILLSILITACQANWQIDLSDDGEPVGIIFPDVVSFFLEELESETGEIPLARVLYQHGFTLINEVSIWENDTLLQTYDWESVAETMVISQKGVLILDGKTFTPARIDVISSPLTQEIDWSIMDISPTIAQVLGLPPLPDAQGQPRSDSKANYGVLILVDGLQYQKLQSLISDGKLSFFGEIDEFHRGLTVYPSITTSSTAALLTSAPPHINGVYGYGYRSTEMKTLFDHANEHGRSVTAVEGPSLAFALRNANVILSGDRDGDGHTDDNVLANSLEVITTSMPDILFIHFHDVDDEGHRYGPESPEYESAIIRVENYLTLIFQALPSNTFIAIFADHGMQNDLSGTGGNHGQLTQSAMIIPIMFLEK
jgi:hypothetical protein